MIRHYSLSTSSTESASNSPPVIEKFTDYWTLRNGNRIGGRIAENGKVFDQIMGQNSFIKLVHSLNILPNCPIRFPWMSVPLLDAMAVGCLVFLWTQSWGSPKTICIIVANLKHFQIQIKFRPPLHFIWPASSCRWERWRDKVIIPTDRFSTDYPPQFIPLPRVTSEYCRASSTWETANISVVIEWQRDPIKGNRVPATNDTQTAFRRGKQWSDEHTAGAGQRQHSRACGWFYSFQ